MRVRHINFNDSRGGSARIVNDLIRYQSESGMDSKAMCARVSDPNNLLLSYRAARKADIVLKGLHKLSVLRNRIAGDTYGILSNTYLEQISREKPDVIHIHNIHGGWFQLSSLEPLHRIAPVVWTLHDEWAYTGHCVTRLGCPNYLTGCGNCPDLERMVKIWRDTTASSRKRKFELYRKLDRERMIITPVSDWVRDHLERSGIWPGKICTVHNGIDIAVFNPLEKESAKSNLQIPVDGTVILFASTGGGADPFKGSYPIISELIKQQGKLIIISLGAADLRLESLKNVLQPGYIKDKHILRKYYSAADIMVYPSHADTFGLVAAEAMACGTPVLASNVGGIPEIIDDGKNGWLFDEYASTQEIISALTGILGDPDSIQRIHANALETIKRKFTSTIMGTRYTEVYEQLLAKK